MIMTPLDLAVIDQVKRERVAFRQPLALPPLVPLDQQVGSGWVVVYVMINLPVCLSYYVLLTIHDRGTKWQTNTFLTLFGIMGHLSID